MDGTWSPGELVKLRFRAGAFCNIKIHYIVYIYVYITYIYIYRYTISYTLQYNNSSLKGFCPGGRSRWSPPNGSLVLGAFKSPERRNTC